MPRERPQSARGERPRSVLAALARQPGSARGDMAPSHGALHTWMIFTSRYLFSSFKESFHLRTRVWCLSVWGWKYSSRALILHAAHSCQHSMPPW